MKVPIYIDLEEQLNYLHSNEFNLSKEDPVVYYQLDITKESPISLEIDPLNAAPPFNPPFDTTKPLILAPRYYIVINSPLDQNLPSIKVNIHKSNNSLLKNKIRVLLEPSFSYGIKSSYKVDYWEWIPNLNIEADITKRKLMTEYWYIPSLDNNYIPHYPYNLYNTNYDFNYRNQYTSRLMSEKIEVIRTIDNNIVEDLILNKKYNHIFCFPKESILSFTEIVNTEVIGHNEESKAWTFNKRTPYSSLKRDISKVDGMLSNGDTETTIEYILPFTREQILITE